MSEAQATKRAEHKPPVQVGARGLVLRSLEDMYRFSCYVAKSGLAPKGLEKAEAILVALQYGFELGLTPAQSLQNIAVINGRPALWGDTMLALCMASPTWDQTLFHEYFEGKEGSDGFRACCRVGRIGRQKPVERTFSVADAKAAGLWGKSGPWQHYPRRMLQMRARSWALRDTFPDVLRGCLAAEEVQDLPSSQTPGGLAALEAKLAPTEPVDTAVEATAEPSEPATEAKSQPAQPTEDGPKKPVVTHGDEQLDSLFKEFSQ